MSDATTESSAPGLDPAAEGLKLPAGIDLIEKVGSGRAATVYRARFQGDVVALKAYKPSAADWYRKKLDKNIAVYEMMQNRAFRKHKDLIKFTAKPYRVIGQDGKSSLCYLQEFVDGITIAELGDRYGSIPGYLMRTGEVIAQTCEERSIPGIDEFMRHCRLRQNASTWMPVMFDFKHIPAERPKEGKKSLLQRIGLDRKPPLPPGFMGEWESLNRRLEKDAV
ncbi:MAG: hypothetical protein AAGH19_10155 [Pseudomonadota bacterium]